MECYKKTKTRNLPVGTIMTKALNRRVINVQILIEVSIYDYHSDIIERMFYGAPNGLRIVACHVRTRMCAHTLTHGIGLTEDAIMLIK